MKLLRVTQGDVIVLLSVQKRSSGLRLQYYSQFFVFDASAAEQCYM
jgi:hypothetical protein